MFAIFRLKLSVWLSSRYCETGTVLGFGTMQSIFVLLYGYMHFLLSLFIRETGLSSHLIFCALFIFFIGIYNFLLVWDQLSSRFLSITSSEVLNLAWTVWFRTFALLCSILALIVHISLEKMCLFRMRWKLALMVSPGIRCSKNRIENINSNLSCPRKTGSIIGAGFLLDFFCSGVQLIWWFLGIVSFVHAICR